jgi:hypothetical protein
LLGKIGPAAKDAIPKLEALQKSSLIHIPELATEALKKIKDDSIAPPQSSLLQTQPVSIAKLIQDGRLFWQLGKLDEAETKLKQALELDPDNQAAIYYLNLIKNTRQQKANGATGFTSHIQKLPLTLSNEPPGRIYSIKSKATDSSRQTILHKLDQIRFDSIQFENTPLSEAVRRLGQEAKQRDPEGKGINFVINPQISNPTNNTRESVNISTYTVSTRGILTNAPLSLVLSVITTHANKPIGYAIEDYGITFSPKAENEPPPLITRRFKINPETFYSELQKAGLLTPEQSDTGGFTYRTNGAINQVPNDSSALKVVQLAVVKYFAAHGLNLQPPNAVFLNDRQGTLLIRATASDLDSIERLLAQLNGLSTMSATNDKIASKPQINIKVKFVEVDSAASRALSIDSFWGTLLRTNGISSAGTSTTSPGNFTGILTEAQFKVVKKALEQRNGTDLLNEAQVTTLSGREAQIQMADMETVKVSGVETNIPFGPVLDVVPDVGTDGNTIRITVTSTVTEFLGHEDPGPFAVDNGTPQRMLPLPRFRGRQMTVTANVFDSQTLVLGNFPDRQVATVAGGFKIKPFPETKKQLLVFITLAIVDSTGSRVHAEGDLPFAKNQIPLQQSR